MSDIVLTLKTGTNSEALLVQLEESDGHYVMLCGVFS